jgi:hypothetical protein
MINAHIIIFNGLSSEEFDVTAHLSFGGDSGATSSFLNRDGVYTEHYDGRYRRIHSYKYNEVMTPRFTLIKQDYSDFTSEENRRILSWLTASDKPGWLEVYHDDSNVLAWQVFGSPISVEQYKMGSGRVVAYEFDFESSAPYAWSRKIEISKKTSESMPFTITCNSDEYNKPLFPKVTIKFGDNINIPVSENPLAETYVMIPNTIYSYNNNYYINIPSESYKGIVHIESTSPSNATVGEYYCVDGKNIVTRDVALDGKTDIWKTVAEIGAATKISNTYISDGVPITKESIVKGGAVGEEITLDGTNKVIAAVSDIIGAETRIIGDDFNWEWLPLVAGDNEITIIGNCEVKFEWYEPRKVGDL